jgi:hypothetical protein
MPDVRNTRFERCPAMLRRRDAPLNIVDGIIGASRRFVNDNPTSG